MLSCRREISLVSIQPWSIYRVYPHWRVVIHRNSLSADDSMYIISKFIQKLFSFQNSKRLLRQSCLTFTLTLYLQYIYIYIYIYISFNIIDIFCQHIFLLIHTYCCIAFYRIRRELIDVFSIIVYIPSTFCPTLGHHQGRIYYKSDETFVFALLQYKSVFIVGVYSICF